SNQGGATMAIRSGRDGSCPSGSVAGTRVPTPVPASVPSRPFRSCCACSRTSVPAPPTAAPALIETRATTLRTSYFINRFIISVLLCFIPSYVTVASQEGPPVPTHHPNAVPSEVLDAVDAADAEARGTTLVAGTSFCVCEKSGDIEPDRGQGLFVDDTRVLSTWRLSLDGQRTEGLSVIPAEPFEATYVGRGRPRRGHDDATLVVERRRLVAAGLRED